MWPSKAYGCVRFVAETTGLQETGSRRTLSQTQVEGEWFTVVRWSRLRVAGNVSGSVAANINRRRPFEYNLRLFLPTLQYALPVWFALRGFHESEETVRVGVNR